MEECVPRDMLVLQLLPFAGNGEWTILRRVPAMNYRVFLNPQPQQLGTFIFDVSQALHVNPDTIPYGRAFEEKEGAYMDQFSRIALGWKYDPIRRQLVVRVAWL
jgi:hypothetical protein